MPFRKPSLFVDFALFLQRRGENRLAGALLVFSPLAGATTGALIDPFLVPRIQLPFQVQGSAGTRTSRWARILHRSMAIAPGVLPWA